MKYFTAKQNGIYEYVVEITNTPLEHHNMPSIKEMLSNITNFNAYDCEIISEITDEIKDFIKAKQEKMIKDREVFGGYFEGMSNIGEPEIQTISKNKFDKKLDMLPKSNNILMIGGRFPNKNAIHLSQIHKAIDENKLPILIIRKSQNAVIISQEEYKRLKELEKGTKVIKSMKMDYITITPRGMEVVTEFEVGVDNNEKRPKE